MDTWQDLWPIWLMGLGAVSVFMVLTWVVSVPRRDASLVDRVWGLSFVVAVWTYAVGWGTWEPRSWLAVVLVTVWGVRLSGYITWRNWSEGEDKRYRAMRDRAPGNFPTRSLVTVFLLQAVLASVISLPLLAATSVAAAGSLTWIDGLAVALWLVGFFFEAVGDLQLARFLRDPDNAGKVMDRGLWRFTRHPNYFGDIMVWVAYFVLALAGGGWWSIIGSLTMIWFIIKVSGVALTDRNMSTGSSKRQGYDAYVRRTSPLIPWPPRG